MESGGSTSARDESVPRLAPGCDSTKLALSPAEGFLLSRIDGQTSWRLLREIGGLPPESVDECLDRWVGDGVLVFGEMPEDQAVPTGPARPAEEAVAPSKSGTSRRAGEASLPGVPDTFDLDIDESLLAPDLDLDRETQRKILVYQGNLSLPAHELLGIAKDADLRQIKKAYFGLSKEFHPDRYFRRNLGSYGERLNVVFKKILEAYELLSDPGTLGAVAQLASPAETPAGDKVERLRQRMPFKRISEEARADNKARADELLKAAEMSRRLGNLAEAENSAKVGLSFDPGHGELQMLALELRQEMLEGQLAEARSRGDAAEALENARALIEIDPDDAERRLLAAEFALECEKPEMARTFAEEARRELGETATICRILAQVHRSRGEPGHALNQAKRALELDPNDEHAKDLIASLKKRRSRRGRSGGVG